jgi:hypothetical protein
MTCQLDASSLDGRLGLGAPQINGASVLSLNHNQNLVPPEERLTI